MLDVFNLKLLVNIKGTFNSNIQNNCYINTFSLRYDLIKQNMLMENYEDVYFAFCYLENIFVCIYWPLDIKYFYRETSLSQYEERNSEQKGWTLLTQRKRRLIDKYKITWLDDQYNIRDYLDCAEMACV